MYRQTKWVLRPLEKKLIYSASVVLWLTGTGWLSLRYLSEQQGVFGSFSQTMLLKIHGAAAMVFLIILGVVIHHISPGWQQKGQRLSAITLLVICGFLILTGWGLYYIGEEHWRHWASIIHCVLGVLLPGFIFFHAYNARARRKRRSGL